MGDDIGWATSVPTTRASWRSDAQPRPAGGGRHAVHRLLRRSELHCGSRKLHHRRITDPHRANHRGSGRPPFGMPDEAPTIATVLKSMGYATGQFGKNHLGDLNQFLPTVHGFDEFFGYLYHLDAMEDPCHPNYPPSRKETVGPRNMLHYLGHERGRPHGAAALGQDRQAEDRGRRRAVSGAHGDRRRRNPRLTRSSSSTRQDTTASHSSSG